MQILSDSMHHVIICLVTRTLSYYIISNSDFLLVWILHQIWGVPPGTTGHPISGTNMLISSSVQRSMKGAWLVRSSLAHGGTWSYPPSWRLIRSLRLDVLCSMQPLEKNHWTTPPRLTCTWVSQPIIHFLRLKTTRRWSWLPVEVAGCGSAT